MEEMQRPSELPLRFSYKKQKGLRKGRGLSGVTLWLRLPVDAE